MQLLLGDILWQPGDVHRRIILCKRRLHRIHIVRRRLFRFFRLFRLGSRLFNRVFPLSRSLPILLASFLRHRFGVQRVKRLRRFSHFFFIRPVYHTRVVRHHRFIITRRRSSSSSRCASSLRKSSQFHVPIVRRSIVIHKGFHSLRIVFFFSLSSLFLNGGG